MTSLGAGASDGRSGAPRSWFGFSKQRRRRGASAAARRASAACAALAWRGDSQTTNAAIARPAARARARGEAAARGGGARRAPRRRRARVRVLGRDDGQRRLERRPQLAVHRDVLHARVLDRPLDGAADRGRRGVVAHLAQEHGVVLRRRAQGPQRARVAPHEVARRRRARAEERRREGGEARHEQQVAPPRVRGLPELRRRRDGRHGVAREERAAHLPAHLVARAARAPRVREPAVARVVDEDGQLQRRRRDQQREQQLAELEVERDAHAKGLGEREALLALRARRVEPQPRQHVGGVQPAHADPVRQRRPADRHRERRLAGRRRARRSRRRLGSHSRI